MSVNYATSNGTATAGSDYTGTTGTLTFAPGETSKSFSIPILDDALVEGNETVNLTLSNPTSGASLGSPSTDVLTITDVEPGQLQFSAASYSVNENSGTALITVTRNGGSTGMVSVSYATSNGTATAGSDYTSTTGTLTFAPGQTSKSFSIPILDDALAEGNETVNLSLSNPTGGASLGSPTTAVLTIVDVEPGQLQFSAASYSVNENGGSALITVTRSSGSSGTVSVTYATSNGTATAGSDYTATTGTLTFAAGQTSKSFSIPILDDALVEGDETVNLSLSNPTGGASLGSPTTAVLTIVDVEPGRLQFSTTSYSVNENGGTALITVTRSLSSTGTVSVNYATSNGTASAGSDYTSTTGTLTFAPGQTSKSFSVPILDDALVEGNETVNLSLSSPTGGASLGSPTTAVLTIADVEPGRLQFSATSYSVNENGGSALITVTRSLSSTGMVSVNYATSNGTASAGSDYTSTTGTLTFAPGETSKSFSIPILDDALVEGNETVNLTLSNPTGGASLGSPTTAVLTIADVEPGHLQFSAASYSVNENGGSALITVTRNSGSTGTVSVSYATSNGTATAGSDYTSTTGTLTFAPGQTSRSFSIPILDDALVEGNETVNLSLSNPTGGASLGSPASAMLTIADVEPGQLQFSAASYSVNENGGSALITVTRNSGSTGTVSVNYATSNGTASAGSDYTSTTGTLTFAPGQTSKSFSIPILDDALVEGDETVNLTLSNPTGGASLGSPTRAVLTITDVEPGRLQFSAASYSMNETSGTALITVTRNGGSTGTVSVTYTTSNGTATAGSDYTATTGTLTFAAGQTSKSFSIPILDDALVEGDETVNLSLSSPTGGASLGSPTTAVLTITDVEPGQLQFSAASYSVNENGGSALITVTRSPSSTGTVSVTYTTSNGTATAGSDYTATTGTLTFAPGETSRSFSIPILDDALVEGDETIFLSLSDPTGGASLNAPSIAILGIHDVEPSPSDSYRSFLPLMLKDY